MEPSLWEIYESGADSDEIAAIIRLSQQESSPDGVRIIARFGDIATCRIQRRSLLDVRANSEVMSLKALRLLVPEDGIDPELPIEEFSQQYTWADDRRPEDLAYKGRGVVVGVVDWGFDFTHPEFRHEDGTTRLLALWDQRYSAESSNPYGYGVIHPQEAIDRALATADPFAALNYHPAAVDSGRGAHGTHVLSIAAGNGRGEGPIGIAPEADLVCVHMASIDRQLASEELSHSNLELSPRLGDSVSLLEAIDFISKLASSSTSNNSSTEPKPIARPWVINLSMGRHGQQHDGTTLVEQGMDALLSVTPGCAIVQSAGNYHQRGIHASGQLRPTEERRLVWQVAEADLAPNELEIWYPGKDVMTVEVRSPDDRFTGRVDLGQRMPILIDGNRVGTIYNRAREPNTLDNHIQIFLYKTAPAGEWEIVIQARDVVDGRYHCWIEREPTRPGKQSHFLRTDADSNCTTGTICNGLRTIAVGAYNGHSLEREIAGFSSAGPTRDGRIKPDLIAPGVYVLAAKSSSREQPDKLELQTRMSGTSMASPHVAGAIALMFEAAARPLKIEETRNMLLASTRQYPGAEDLRDRIGSGYLDIDRAIRSVLEINSNPLNLKQTVDSYPKTTDRYKPKNLSPNHSIEVSGMSKEEKVVEILSDLPAHDMEADSVESIGVIDRENLIGNERNERMESETPSDISMQEFESLIYHPIADYQMETDDRCDTETIERVSDEGLESETPSDISIQEFESLVYHPISDYQLEADDRCDTETIEYFESLAGFEISADRVFDRETIDTSTIEIQSRLVDIANDVLAQPQLVRYSRLFLHEVLSRAGIADWLKTVEPARLYDAYVYNANPTLLTRLEQVFERVALPFETLRQPIQSGDLLVRRLDGGFAHVAIIADPERLTLRQLDERGITPESRRSGDYVRVVEGGSRPHRREDNFARLITEPGDRVPFNHLILRVPSVEIARSRTDLDDEYAPETSDRRSPEYIRWIQQSLNQLINAGLVVDGVMGSQTRSVIRRFQSQNSLSVDGVVGSRTEAAMVAAGASPPPGSSPLVEPLPIPFIGAMLNPARWGPILSSRLSSSAFLRTGNAVSFLIDGTDTFRAMVNAIRTARASKHYIYLLGWVLKDDFELIPGDARSTIQRLFADASSRGVQIRVMLWDQVGTQNSAEVDRINALSTGAAILDDDTPQPIAGFGSHHQKVLVVKGRQGLISFCGGIDINDDRIRVTASGKGEPLHDVHCQILGPSAFDLLQTFIRRWDHHPAHTKIDTRRGRLLGRSEPVPAPISTPATDIASRNNCSVCIARTFNPVRPTTVKERDIQTLLIESIRNARRFIYLEDQYLINPLAATELRAAIPNIEHLTILIPATEITGLSSSNSTGLPCAWKLRREFINTLMMGLSARDTRKVRIFILVNPPPRIPPNLGKHTYVHAKTWVFDDELAVIGSANCNRRSWTHDSEVNAFIFENLSTIDMSRSYTPTFAQQFRMQLWAEHLNISPIAVSDGVSSARLWLSPPVSARVMPYNPTAGSDSIPVSVCNATIDTIDPEIPNLTHTRLA